ncbi:hypothetical protein M8C21_002141 [Ambrosia artemisiifolia]|uniref:Phosphotyrosine protein phosphatase I domain-containing protein n=1 Tax=Ambrosia artemisiifolia TaxID=4212 RepID=A0AAD5CFU9_AMBAR|nr:hypothetical protein M8C21_002141 [Ambrosia artemisiifolia]
MKTLYTISSLPTIRNILPFCHPKSLNLVTFIPLNPYPLSQSSNLFNQRSKTKQNPIAIITSSMASTAQTDKITEKPFSVLFVCLGNICRSPAAEGVFTDLVKKRNLSSKFVIDSAGTINYHEDILNAFERWRFREALPADAANKVKLMCSYCKKHDETEVPDPYYGGQQGFEKVLDLLEDACESLLDSILAENNHISDS